MKGVFFALGFFMGFLVGFEGVLFWIFKCCVSILIIFVILYGQGFWNWNFVETVLSSFLFFVRFVGFLVLYIYIFFFFGFFF